MKKQAEARTTLNIRLGNGLLLLILLSLLLLLIIYLLPDSVFRIILGFLFILLFPGYALTVAIFPAKADVSGWLRLAISIGLSIAAVVILGLFLNYTAWGITLESLLTILVVFLLICSGIAWRRQKRLKETERFIIEYTLVLSWWRWSIWEKGVSVAIVLVILGAIGTATYALANPNPDQPFTEFYILGPQGNARDYTRELTVGRTSEVTIGIINHEHAINDYEIEVSLNGIKMAELKGITLEHGEKWEGNYSFIPSVPGINQVMEFYLIKNGEVDATMTPLRLHVNVSR